MRFSLSFLTVCVAPVVVAGCNSPAASASDAITFQITELRGATGRFAATVRVVNAGAVAARIGLCESFERKTSTGWSLVTYGDFQCLDADKVVDASASAIVSLDGLAVAAGDTIRFAPRYTLSSANQTPGTPTRGTTSAPVVVR